MAKAQNIDAKEVKIDGCNTCPEFKHRRLRKLLGARYFNWKEIRPSQ